VILDLKGSQYAGTIVPSCSFLVVGFSGDAAKVEAHATDFLQLEHTADLLGSLSGALEGGGVDAALLGFEDVAGDEEAGAAAAAKNAGKRRKGGAASSADEGASASDAGTPAKKRAKGAKMLGRAVKVGGKKKKAAPRKKVVKRA